MINTWVYYFWIIFYIQILFFFFQKCIISRFPLSYKILKPACFVTSTIGKSLWQQLQISFSATSNDQVIVKQFLNFAYNFYGMLGCITSELRFYIQLFFISIAYFSVCHYLRKYRANYKACLLVTPAIGKSVLR